MPVFIYKSMNYAIAPTICELFNSSILEGISPKNLKLAEFIAIYKTGSKSTVTNYRPISLFPTMSKIFEKLINTRLKHHFELTYYCMEIKLDLGPKAAHLTDITISRRMLRLDQFQTTSTFLDLSKALDNIPQPYFLTCQRL